LREEKKKGAGVGEVSGGTKEQEKKRIMIGLGMICQNNDLPASGGGGGGGGGGGWGERSRETTKKFTGKKTVGRVQNEEKRT